jgi:hypothetical protein
MRIVTDFSDENIASNFRVYYFKIYVAESKKLVRYVVIHDFDGKPIRVLLIVSAYALEKYLKNQQKKKTSR